MKATTMVLAALAVFCMCAAFAMYDTDGSDAATPADNTKDSTFSDSKFTYKITKEAKESVPGQ